MRRFSKKPKSLLAEWLRTATPAMRDDLCRRVPCPINSLYALASGLRDIPRFDRGVAIISACNEIRQEAIDRVAAMGDGGGDGAASAVVPPLMTIKGLLEGAGKRKVDSDYAELQALIDGVNRDDR